MPNGFFETFKKIARRPSAPPLDPLGGLIIINNFAIFSKFYIIYLKNLLNFQNSSVLSGNAALRTPYKTAALQVTKQTNELKLFWTTQFFELTAELLFEAYQTVIALKYLPKIQLFF